MIRRGFLAMLGLGPIASLVAKQGEEIYESVPAIYASPSPRLERIDETSWIKEAMDKMKDKETWIQQWINNQHSELYGGVPMDRIDPDIKSMKSFSDSAKMRIYMRRLAERQYNKEHWDLSNRLKSYMTL